MFRNEKDVRFYRACETQIAAAMRKAGYLKMARLVEDDCRYWCSKFERRGRKKKPKATSKAAQYQKAYRARQAEGLKTIRVRVPDEQVAELVVRNLLPGADKDSIEKGLSTILINHLSVIR